MNKSKTIAFSFELNTKYMQHLKEKSSYNYNFYLLDLAHYGDYITPRKCNVLLEDMEDDSFHAIYSLGYFDDNDKFQPMWTWCDDWKMDLSI